MVRHFLRGEVNDQHQAKDDGQQPKERGNKQTNIFLEILSDKFSFYQRLNGFCEDEETINGSGRGQKDGSDPILGFSPPSGLDNQLSGQAY